MKMNDCYDMKNEFRDFGGIGSAATNLEKVNRYRSYNAQAERKDWIDCDACMLATAVYRTYYDFLEEYKQRNMPGFCYLYELYKDNEIYYGDTMTSFQHIRKHVERCYPITKADIESENIRVQLWKQLELFAGIYHSAGNQIPVPKYFNISRAGKYAKLDFWDLTMQKIYQAYMLSKDGVSPAKEPLYELLDSNCDNKKITEAVRCCEKWLTKFVDENGRISFDVFVKQNFLEMYCETKNGKYLPIKNQYHVWDAGAQPRYALPESEVEMLRFLENLNSQIMNRNEIILRKAKERMEEDGYENR